MLPRYEQAARTDMTRVPVPRYDLLAMQHYLFGSIQFSRGCPFQCEFCDIIVTFGRRPRLKTAGQIISELEALRRQGVEIVFIVDDNLIGNKKAVAPLLEALGAWQEAHGFPFIFATEASLDLAEDAGADGADARRQHPERVRRHRDAQRSIAPGDVEAPEREDRAAPSSSGCMRFRMRASKCGRA